MMETHELILQPGLIVNQEFFDFETMQQCAKNWLYLEKYRLVPVRFMVIMTVYN